MAKKTLRIDYTVYAPNYQPGAGCWDFRTLNKARSAARGLGSGSRIYRNFNLESKRGRMPHDYWSSKFYWIWNGHLFVRKIDLSVEASGWHSRSGSVILSRSA
jgi:hypothetical protein